ncbi:hypothetical protein [Microbacterium tumbae]
MRSPKLQQQRDRNDLNTTIVVGLLAIGWLLYDGIRRLAELFQTAGSVTVATRVPAQDVAVGDGAEAVMTSAILTVPDVSDLSVISLVLAIVARAALLIAVAVLGVVLCRRLLRGVVFDRVNTRLTLGMSIGLLAAGLGPVWFENIGLNGVFAALGAAFDEFRWPLFGDAVPLFVAAIAVGMLVLVFRRGAELQKDAEGLV